MKGDRATLRDLAAGWVNRLGRLGTSGALVGLVAALLFLGNLVRYPGESNPDSDSQYAQAVTGQYNDWHPPIMAWLWSMLRLIGDGNGPMFVFHIGCYWLGFGLCAMALSRAGRGLAAWGLLAAAAFPPFLMMNINIHKDVGLAVSFLLGFAIIFFFRSRKARVPLGASAISSAFLLYGTLVRFNGVFGGVALVFYAFAPRLLTKPVRLLVASIPVAALLLFAGDALNHKVLKAAPAGALGSLQLFDMVGVAAKSRDLSVFGPDHALTAPDVDRCYTPIFWDTLSRSRCPMFSAYLARFQGNAGSKGDLTRLWLAAIVKHPLAYAEHRISHFNSEMFFFVPSHHASQPILRALVGDSVDGAGPASPVKKVLNALRESILNTPAFWFVLAVALLVTLSWRELPEFPRETEAALALLWSSLLYASAYLMIGVATDRRYQFWSMIATASAFVISWPEWRRRLADSTRLRLIWAGSIGLTLLVMSLARAVEPDALLSISSLLEH